MIVGRWAPLLLGLLFPFLSAAPAAADSPLNRVRHVVVIAQEGWSYDSLLGSFGAEDSRDAAASVAPSISQVDAAGDRIWAEPGPMDMVAHQPDKRFPSLSAPVPFSLENYVKSDQRTQAIAQGFQREQAAVDGGRMDRFVSEGDAGYLPMGRFDATTMPGFGLGVRYTVADRFFHAAYGGTMLNHLWLICGCTPTWDSAPPELRSGADPAVLPDGNVVNDVYSAGAPHPAGVPLMPALPNPTIGDALTHAGVSWGWYSGGWTRAEAGEADPSFVYQAQPFAYFERYAPGTSDRAQHLKDEGQFLEAVKNHDLPSVSFVQPLGISDGHPGYADLITAQQHLLDLLTALQRSDYWQSTVTFIVGVDNGGHWDHVAPPVIDRWGPGTRVPMIIVSPLAKKAYVDHSTYDTTSIARFIERRWNIAPLGVRDAAAGDLTGTLDLYEGYTPIYGTTAFGTWLASGLLALLAGSWLVLRRRR